MIRQCWLLSHMHESRGAYGREEPSCETTLSGRVTSYLSLHSALGQVPIKYPMKREQRETGPNAAPQAPAVQQTCDRATKQTALYDM